MFRPTYKLVAIAIPIFLVICLGGGLWIRHALEPVGQIGSRTLTFEGTTYISDGMATPIQARFSHHIGRTQGAAGIYAIDRESPKDYVFVIGEMWQTLFRRKSLPAPRLIPPTVAHVTFHGRSVKDSEVIRDLMDAINSKKAQSELLSTDKETKFDAFSIELKREPGLRYDFLVQTQSGQIFLETNTMYDKYLEIDKTPLGTWVKGHMVIQ